MALVGCAKFALSVPQNNVVLLTNSDNTTTILVPLSVIDSVYISLGNKILVDAVRSSIVANLILILEWHSILIVHNATQLSLGIPQPTDTVRGSCDEHGALRIPVDCSDHRSLWDNSVVGSVWLDMRKVVNKFRILYVIAHIP